MLNTRNLYELMREQNIETLAELSRKTRIPYTTLNYMINGHDMHVSTALQVSNFFKVPIDNIIERASRIVVVNDHGMTFMDTANIYEALCKSNCNIIAK